MKPTKNKVFCNNCNRAKMLFETQKKAENFIRFNKDEIEAETGIVPQRAYYCVFCGGWHITHFREKRGKTRNEKLFEVFNPAKDEREYHIEPATPKEKPEEISNPEKKRYENNPQRSINKKAEEKPLVSNVPKKKIPKPIAEPPMKLSNQEVLDSKRQSIEKQVKSLTSEKQDKFVSKHISQLIDEIKILTDPVALNKRIKDLRVKLEIYYIINKQLKQRKNKNP
ncbi:MAG: hypothetical protein WCL06_10640 [Bacteroidota bacterium]